jgi:hypothetical protein
VQVAVMMVEISEGSTLAIAKASCAARVPRLDAESSLEAYLRSRMPVLVSIHSAETPTWGESSSLVTTRSGTALPTPVIVGCTVRRWLCLS